jgi:transcriptional regulator with XRE-family HTH domain
MSPEDFGAHLRQLREGKGLSQAVAARAAGIHMHTWHRWENGGIPQITRAQAIANALQIPLAELLAPNPERIHVAELSISPQALAQVKRKGHPEARRLAEALTDTLAAKVEALAASPPAKAPSIRAKEHVAARAATIRKRIRARELTAEAHG